MFGFEIGIAAAAAFPHHIDTLPKTPGQVLDKALGHQATEIERLKRENEELRLKVASLRLRIASL